MLICPVCGGPLTVEKSQAFCTQGHRFDIAREGYVNLLRSGKSGDRIGDDKQAARYRRDFLNKGYYSLLCSTLEDIFVQERGALLDICCGEGYYTSALGKNPNLQVYGFDISKEMVRLAAKRGFGTYFVANLASIPVAEASFDFATHLFAPFQEASFLRILKPGGRLFTVVPGREHLWGLKQAVYDKPYYNDEKLPETETLRFLGSRKVCGEITLTCQEDIQAVFRMTPYYYRTSPEDRAKLDSMSQLTTPISFVIGEYQKPE